MPATGRLWHGVALSQDPPKRRGGGGAYGKKVSEGSQCGSDSRFATRGRLTSHTTRKSHQVAVAERSTEGGLSPFSAWLVLVGGG
jgi:hypothetical protein